MHMPSAEESPGSPSNPPLDSDRDFLLNNPGDDASVSIPRSRSFSTAAPRPSSDSAAAAMATREVSGSGAASRSRNLSAGSATGAGGSGSGEADELAASDGAGARSPRSPLRLPGVPVRAAVGRWRGDVEVQRSRVYNQHMFLN